MACNASAVPAGLEDPTVSFAFLGEAVAFAAGKLRLRRTEGCPGLHTVLVADKGIDPQFCFRTVLSVTPHFCSDYQA